MSDDQKIAFLFPGQGAQYPGMGKDFVENFSIAKQVFEEADDLLRKNLSAIILRGDAQTLTETKNSQIAIYVVSFAILRVLQQQFPHLQPIACAGLSLGEYTAITASQRWTFADGLHLVQQRGQFMNDACEKTRGTMAVVLGLEAKEVESMVQEINLPQDLWAANFNCPGQVVISGTLKGIEVGTAAAKAKGAKKVVILEVHGAFHSGLMKEAEDRLTPYILQVSLTESPIRLMMNVPGDYVKDLSLIRQNLIKQVTSSVRWEQGIRRMKEEGIDLFLEIGCGKTLTGFNKRIDPAGTVFSIEKVSDLAQLVPK